jgi:hypothetical protein
VEFPAGGTFFSTLCDGDEGFVRRDFCTDCWESGEEERGFCFWRTRREVADAERVVDTQLMLGFFDRLDQPDTHEKTIFRFVLGLYLMRRKELKLQEIARSNGGNEFLLCERRSTGEAVRIENPGLTEDQLQHSADRLRYLLDGAL